MAEQGLLDIDLAIAHYWPEFGCNGKEAITTRMVLSHRAGLAVALSLTFGIGATLLVGALCYLLLVPAALAIGKPASADAP